MDTLDAETEISHRTLKNEQGRVFRELASVGKPVAVCNRGQVDGILVPPAIWDELRSRAQEAERLRAALPLLLAAVRSGVEVPSATFEALGLPVADDWQALNALVAALPVRLTHDPEGQPLSGRRVGLTLEPAIADDDELNLV